MASGARSCKCGSPLLVKIPAAAGNDAWEGYLVNELGRGYFGKVYRAVGKLQSEPTPRCFAVKIFRVADESQQDTKRFEDYFKAEAGHLRRLQLARIPRLYASYGCAPAAAGSGTGPATPLFVIECVEGLSIQQLLDSPDPDERPELQDREAFARRFLQQGLEILRYTHGMDVIHRDITPSNVMIDSKDGGLYLIDFGIAKHLPPGSKDSGRDVPRLTAVTRIANEAYMDPLLASGTDSHLRIEHPQQLDL
eukprot:tig00020941_g16219.t1